MRRHGFALAATLCAALALGACTSTRFGGAPVQSATAAPMLDPEPIEPVPSGPIEAAPLAPIEGQPLPPPGMTPPPGGTDVAALPPAAPPPAAPASRTAMVGAWTARDASGGSCRVQLSSSPALDLYKASASGCANRDLARVTGWDFRDGEVYLYQPGGAVAARLRPAGGSLEGVLAKSGAPLTLAR